MRKTTYFVRNTLTGESRSVPVTVHDNHGKKVTFDEPVSLEAGITYDFGEEEYPLFVLDFSTMTRREIPGSGFGNKRLCLPEDGEVSEYEDHS